MSAFYDISINLYAGIYGSPSSQLSSSFSHALLALCGATCGLIEMRRVLIGQGSQLNCVLEGHTSW